MCPKARIPFFLVHEYWGSEAAHLGWSIGSYETSSTRKPCTKAVPETDYFTEQKQYHKRTTLHTLKIPLQSVRSEEDLHYCLSKVQESCHLTSNKCHMAGVCWRSCCKAVIARKARTIAMSKAQGSCHLTSNNQPIHEFGYPLVIPYPGCTA